MLFIVYDLKTIIAIASVVVFLLVVAAAVYYLARETRTNTTQKKEEQGSEGANLQIAPIEETPEIVTSVTNEQYAEVTEPSLPIARVPTRVNSSGFIVPVQRTLSPLSLKRTSTVFSRTETAFSVATSRSSQRRQGNESDGLSDRSYGLIVDPPCAHPGDSVNIYISVFGGIRNAQSCPVELKVGGELLYSDALYPNAGRSTTIRFPIYAGPPGYWTVELNDISLQLRIIDRPSRSV